MNLKHLINIKWREVNIFDVIKGCGEYFLSDYTNRGEAYKEVVKYRLNFCRSCPLYDNGVCDTTKQEPHIKTGVLTSGCGCQINCKSALRSQSCPLGKWLSIE